jgi:uncharacterized damage-inducible protein DinB
MNWIAPPVERVDEDYTAGERGLLEGVLDRQRDTLRWKCAGLTGEQLARQAVPPSDLSLLGLLRHVADAERAWFRRRFGRQDLPELYGPVASFTEADPARAEADYQRLIDEQAACRAAAAGAPLDATFQHEEVGEMTLRWIYTHLIEEYARHNGHADLLRQVIDGTTGE